MRAKPTKSKLQTVIDIGQKTFAIDTIIKAFAITAVDFKKLFATLQETQAKATKIRAATKQRATTQSFNATVVQKGYSERYIQLRYQYYRRLFFLYTVYFLGLLLAVVWLAQSAPWAAMGIVGITLIPFAGVIRYSVQCFRIRHSRFDGFGVWLSNPSQWIPSSYGGGE